MYTGYNALSMALAMPTNGVVVACEIEETYVNIAKPFFKEVREFPLSKQHDSHSIIHIAIVQTFNLKSRIAQVVLPNLALVQHLNLALCKFSKIDCCFCQSEIVQLTACSASTSCQYVLT